MTAKITYSTIECSNIGKQIEEYSERDDFYLFSKFYVSGENAKKVLLTAWTTLFTKVREQAADGLKVVILTREINEACQIVSELYCDGYSNLERCEAPRTLMDKRSGGEVWVHPYSLLKMRSVKDPRFIWVINIKDENGLAETLAPFLYVKGTCIRDLEMILVLDQNKISEEGIQGKLEPPKKKKSKNKKNKK